MDHGEYIRRSPGSKTGVLMLHGIVGTPRYFDAMIPLIPESWDVYNILLDGHGKTVSDFSHTSMKKWKSQVNLTLNEMSRRYNNIIILGHSMGTLLGLNASHKYSDKIRAMILFAVPVKIFIKPSGVLNALRVVFKCTDENNPMQVAARNAHSIDPDPKLWRYVGWIPRFFELLGLIHHVRNRIEKISVPCYAFQAVKDELVSKNAIKVLNQNLYFKNFVLKNSRHYYFDEQDFSIVEDKLVGVFDNLQKQTR